MPIIRKNAIPESTHAAQATQAAQITHDGRADFDCYIVSINGKLAYEELIANLQLDEKQFEANRYRPELKRNEMPQFKPNSLVLIESDSQVIGAGFIIDELDDEVAPSFQMFVSAMQEPVKLRHAVSYSQTGRPMAGYKFSAESDSHTFKGVIRKQHRVDADRLRDEIYAAVAPHIQEAFWSPAERMSIQAKAKETERFQLALAALIEQVEPAHVTN